MATKRDNDELEPLRRMCHQGRLFDVQQWIKAGNPVALKELPPPRRRRNGPLCIAIDHGFHSLVQVLLEGGTPIEEGRYHALHHAVQLRRRDLVTLLIEHGAKVQDVSMQTVLATWDRAMADLFVANSASLVDDLPIAWGLINKIKTTLGVFKQYVGQQPKLIEQVEIALRHHARKGNAKWVSLMLWAGADPWSLGPDDASNYDVPPFDDDSEPLQYSAVEQAVTYGRVEVLSLKNFLTPPNPKRPESMKTLCHAWRLRDETVVRLLLDRGHVPALYDDRCSSLISGLLMELSSTWNMSSYHRINNLLPRYMDTSKSAELLAIIGMLFAHGAKWQPKSPAEIRRVRGSLLQMAPWYTYDFVQMAHDNMAARRRDMQELIRPATMTKLLEKRCKKIPALVAALPEEFPTDAAKDKSGIGPESPR